MASTNTNNLNLTNNAAVAGTSESSNIGYNMAASGGVVATSNANAGVGGKRKHLSGPCYLKMLVNNLVAGSIIGKNGAVITSILNQTGCTVKLSPSNSFFPNTTDRVVVMSGKLEQINNALLIILGKIKEIASQYAYEPNCGNQLNRLSCKIVVPKSAVSAIIGKGGQQIRDLQASTDARIHISSREDDFDERTVTITGGVEAMQNAALAVASSIQNTANLKDHMYVVYNNTCNNLMTNQLGVGNGIGAPMIPLAAGGYMQHQFAGGFNNDPMQFVGGGVLPHQGGAYDGGNMMHGVVGGQVDILSMHCEITMEIPDVYVGPVIGKNGGSLADIIQNSGARVQISQKGDLVPDTNNRKVIISGTVLAVHQAHIMLLQRLDHFQNLQRNSMNSNKTNNSSGNNGQFNTNGNKNNPDLNNVVQHTIVPNSEIMSMTHNNSQNLNMQRANAGIVGGGVAGGVQLAHSALQQYAAGGY